MAVKIISFTGLGLLVTGSVVGLMPLLPAVPASGAAMRGRPDWPIGASGLVVAGLILLLWQRWRGAGRDAS
ncbi:MAG: hypothetical protein ACRD01_09090 [Terriglobales bacterium]